MKTFSPQFLLVAALFSAFTATPTFAAFVVYDDFNFCRALIDFLFNHHNRYWTYFSPCVKLFHCWFLF